MRALFRCVGGHQRLRVAGCDVRMSHRLTALKEARDEETAGLELADVSSLTHP